jgi:hypothetical protein
MNRVSLLDPWRLWRCGFFFGFRSVHLEAHAPRRRNVASSRKPANLIRLMAWHTQCT